MTIIDRALGQSIPFGTHTAVIYQATHDSVGVDVGFKANFPTIQGVRGAYHFANPDASSGRAQAALFIATVKANGFVVDKDIWALDVEGNVSLRGAALEQWIIDFMETCKASLGDRGFLYIGWPFFVTHISAQDFSLLHRYRWWLPDYGSNDGQPHPLGAGEPFAPVLHQYTSVPWDTSSVTDPAAWAALFTPGVTVRPRYNPPLKFVDICVFHHPTAGLAFAGVQADGSVFCPVPGSYLGGANGRTFFRGLTACEIAGTSDGYAIKASNGKLYSFPSIAL